jgi:hypothetical protein
LSTEKPYAELVAQAEHAVTAVKDAELRRVAFERVLSDLLTGGRGRPSVDVAHAESSVSVRAAGAKPRRRKASVSRVGTKRGGPQQYIEDLAAEGFFKIQKTISEVKAELENRGHHIPLTSLSGPLQKLCQKKTLRRQKIDADGKKKTYGYSRW